MMHIAIKKTSRFFGTFFITFYSKKENIIGNSNIYFLFCVEIMSMQTTYKSKEAVGNNWKQNSATYTGDDLIDAYIRGKKAGRDQQKKILLERISKNVSTATQLSEKLYKIAIDQKIELFEIHIKAENISTYTALFLVNTSHFVSDKFRNIYTAARQLKNESETDTFYISFSFTPKTEQLGEDRLVTDGFFLKYEKQGMS